LCPPNQHLPRKLLALTPLGLTVSNPPTQAEVQAGVEQGRRITKK